jgi:hypothetical protein
MGALRRALSARRAFGLKRSAQSAQVPRLMRPNGRGAAICLATRDNGRVSGKGAMRAVNAYMVALTK